MRTAYQYRLRLTRQQQATVNDWLELCRRQYNYRLAERFNWYEQNRCDIDACPLIVMENTIGIDMGLKSFFTDDLGQEVAIPQHYHQAEKRLKRLQRSLSRKKKDSNRRKKAIKRVAKAHLKVSNTRKDFHYKTAKNLLCQGKHVAHEKLNIKGLAQSKLAKSVNDAGWGQFLQIIGVKAERAGLLTIAVNPNGTSQNCSGCGAKVPKTLSDRIHACPKCGLTLDRDHNAAINIKHLAVGHSVNQAQVTSVSEASPKEIAIAGVTEKPALYALA
jgi:putative transposase